MAELHCERLGEQIGESAAPKLSGPRGRAAVEEDVRSGREVPQPSQQVSQPAQH